MFDDMMVIMRVREIMRVWAEREGESRTGVGGEM